MSALIQHSKNDTFLNVAVVKVIGDTMSGWNPRDPHVKKEVIDIVNKDFWWHETFSRNTKINHAIESLATEVIRLRTQDEKNEKQTIFLMKLLEELAKYPDKTSSKAALGNERETYEAFTEYVNYVISTANKRLELFVSMNAYEPIARQ